MKTLRFAIPIAFLLITKVGYTLFANHNKTWMKWKFHRKNCVCETQWKPRYTLFVDRPKFCAWIYIFSLHEKSLWVRHGDCLPGKIRRTVFRKMNCVSQTLQITFYTLFALCTNFVFFIHVLLWFVNNVQPA